MKLGLAAGLSGGRTKKSLLGRKLFRLGKRVKCTNSYQDSEVFSSSQIHHVPFCLCPQALSWIYRKLEHFRVSSMGGSCACCSSDDLIRESKMNVLAMQSPVSVTPDPREGSRTETSTESESPQPPLTGTGSRESKVITSPIAAVNRFENISKEQSVQCLIDISGIVNVYVPRDEFHRWKLSQKILTNLNICAELNVAYVHHKNGMFFDEHLVFPVASICYVICTIFPMRCIIAILCRSRVQRNEMFLAQKLQESVQDHRH